MSVKPSQFDTVRKLLDGGMLRHKVISQNVANVNTPGYRRLTVTFEDQLVKYFENGASVDPRTIRPQVVEAPGGAARADGNNVDIDQEMGELSKNTLLMELYTQLLANQTSTMRSAIRGQS